MLENEEKTEQDLKNNVKASLCELIERPSNF